MRFLPLVTFSLLALSSTAHADNSNAWVELGLGATDDFVTTSINIKVGDNRSNWALEFGGYGEMKFFSDGPLDRADNTSFDPEVYTLGITKNWNSIGKWGYLDAGIGLGVADGTWASNCESVINDSGWISDEYCDSTSGLRPGIPVHVSAVFGKYVGIGVTLKAFITEEDAHAGVTLTLPIGDFTK